VALGQDAQRSLEAREQEEREQQGQSG